MYPNISLSFFIEDFYFYITIVMQRQHGFVKIINTTLAFDSKITDSTTIQPM